MSFGVIKLLFLNLNINEKDEIEVNKNEEISKIEDKNVIILSLQEKSNYTNKNESPLKNDHLKPPPMLDSQIAQIEKSPIYIDTKIFEEIKNEKEMISSIMNHEFYIANFFFIAGLISFFFNICLFYGITISFTFISSGKIK